MPWRDLYSLNQNRRQGHVAVTTPTSTEGMTGPKDQQGKPPRPVTWGTKWRSRYKRKKRQKHFKEETSASKRVTLEKKQMGNPVQTCSEPRQPLPEQSAHPAYHLSFHLLGPAGHGALPFPPTQTGYRKPEKGAAASVSNHNSMKPSPTLSSK